MKTQQLSNNLRNHAANIMHQKRKLQQGIIKPLTVSAYQHNIRQYMVTDVINPIVKELNEVTGQKITFQIETSTGFYYLLVDFKKFAVIYCLIIPLVEFLSNFLTIMERNVLLQDH